MTDGANQSCTNTVTSQEADSCTVAGLTNGKSYGFRVTAMNARGASASSLESNTVTPADSSAVTQVAAGYDFGCVLHVDAAVSCWGVNGSGQLGDGSTTTHTSPVTVTGITSATQIALS
ncbi:MAG TPA: hypothetical protein VND89_01405 [Acidimicrobiales bacterium]|nr:hypothetical protein [Acidimicrobiales bacterium]